jgi:hypothetical protein
MDYKFVVTLLVNIVGLGIMAWQLRLMKLQSTTLPSARSTRRIELERKLSRKLYTPVLVMAMLVLVSWLPFIIAATRPPVLPNFLAAWGGTTTGCNAQVDTSGFVAVRDKYRLFVVCHIMDATVDELEDRRIAVSKPFNITGGTVSILILYKAADPIMDAIKPGVLTGFTVALLPKAEDGSAVKQLSDVEKLGGQILTPGGKLKD